MRNRHELEHGVLCESCGKHCIKGEYTSIRHITPIIEDTTGRYKTIDRFNFCNKCYNKYMKFMKDFAKRSKQYAN